jgi:hypothetical protein
VAEYQFDIYALFWEQGIAVLKPNDGLIGYITPNTWLNNQGSTKLRDFILRHTAVLSIADYSRVKVFPKAVVLPIISILKKTDAPSGFVEIHIPVNGSTQLSHRIPQALWVNDKNKILNINLLEGDAQLRQKIELGKVPLEALAEVKFGIKLYETGKGDPPQKSTDAKEHIFEANRKLNASYRMYLEGKDVNRYSIAWEKRWLKYGKNLAAPRAPELFQGQRLLVRRIVGTRLIASWTDSDYVTSQLLQIVKPYDPEQSKYLLGLINSSLLAYFFRKKYNRQDKTFPEIRIYELASLPIRPINFSDPAEKAQHDQLVSLVEQMLAYHKSLAAAQSPQDQARLERHIETTDRAIDALVYALYGLSEEEIRIVES